MRDLAVFTNEDSGLCTHARLLWAYKA